jgi:hypothetical protein
MEPMPIFCPDKSKEEPRRNFAERKSVSSFLKPAFK